MKIYNNVKYVQNNVKLVNKVNIIVYNAEFKIKVWDKVKKKAAVVYKVIMKIKIMILFVKNVVINVNLV